MVSTNLQSYFKHWVTHNQTQIFYSREVDGLRATIDILEGVTMSVTASVLWVQQEIYGSEDAFISWMGKEPEDTYWKIYWTKIPARYQGLPSAIKVGIYSAQFVEDIKLLTGGPRITMNNLRNMDLSSSTPKIEFELEDGSGIASANGNIYFSINEIIPTYDLTVFYTASSSTNGQVSFTVGTDAGTALREGMNYLYFTATAVDGDISQQTLMLKVCHGLSISQVLNYPNPYQDDCHIAYQLSQSAEIAVRIYDLSGHLLFHENNLPGNTGYNEFYWHGKDDNGRELANGVYYLVIIAKDGGKMSTGRTKLVKLK